VVDAQQSRRHGPRHYVAEFLLDLGTDHRDIAVFGMRALGTPQSQDPLE
jgi:hypothetical protein